jgi:hypothetical protein
MYIYIIILIVVIYCYSSLNIIEGLTSAEEAAAAAAAGGAAGGAAAGGAAAGGAPSQVDMQALATATAADARSAPPPPPLRPRRCPSPVGIAGVPRDQQHLYVLKTSLAPLVQGAPFEIEDEQKSIFMSCYDDFKTDEDSKKFMTCTKMDRYTNRNDAAVRDEAKRAYEKNMNPVIFIALGLTTSIIFWWVYSNTNTQFVDAAGRIIEKGLANVEGRLPVTPAS